MGENLHTSSTSPSLLPRKFWAFITAAVLANNAGVMALQDKAATTDGFDLQMQNHLSHHVLNNGCMS